MQLLWLHFDRYHLNLYSYLPSSLSYLVEFNCGFLETFYGEDSLHLVLEYCAEGSLEKYLEKKIIPSGRSRFPTNPNDPECVHLGASLPEDKILSFLCQILSALAYHHARGVVHEDMKPANIM